MSVSAHERRISTQYEERRISARTLTHSGTNCSGEILFIDEEILFIDTALARLTWLSRSWDDEEVERIYLSTGTIKDAQRANIGLVTKQ